jgi:hypothetical protein
LTAFAIEEADLLHVLRGVQHARVREGGIFTGVKMVLHEKIEG